MQIGDTATLDVTSIAHGGVCVARDDGRVVFVAGAIPGERVVARIIDVKTSFARADVVEVRSASPDRQRHIWPEADVSRAPEDRPGGADLGHIRLSAQRALKAQVLHDSLARFAGPVVAERLAELTGAPSSATQPEAIQPEVIQPEAVGGGLIPVEPAGGDGETPDGTGWRTRVSVQRDEDGRFGPFSARSHRVVDVETWPLLDERLGEWARALARSEPSRSGPGRVDGLVAADGEIVRIDRHARAHRGGGRGAERIIRERAAGADFRLRAGGFWQVHRLAPDTLHAAVSHSIALAGDAVGGWSGAAEHLDLYGGVGLLAHALRQGIDTGDVTSVEGSRHASADAAANVGQLARTRAVHAPVEAFLRQPTDRETGMVVLDPPRSGAGSAVVTAIAARRPRAVTMVACDPVAFARDLGAFADLGYAPISIRAFDLFPNSHHMEALALLVAAS